MLPRYYAGIGSRQTPVAVQNTMINVAMSLAQHGFTLRSGGAEGADLAFEIGADAGKGAKEIFLPWPNFNRNISNFVEPSSTAFQIAEMLHPNWEILTHGAKRLMARNTHQILGPEIGNSPRSEFVICWTPGGRMQGGTAQALRIAEHYQIPVINLGNGISHETLEQELTKLVDSTPV